MNLQIENCFDSLDQDNDTVLKISNKTYSIILDSSKLEMLLWARLSRNQLAFPLKFLKGHWKKSIPSLKEKVSSK